MSQQPTALPHHIASAAIHNLSVIRGVLQMPIKPVEKEGSFVRWLFVTRVVFLPASPIQSALAVEEKESGAVLRICMYRRNHYKSKGFKGWE